MRRALASACIGGLCCLIPVACSQGEARRPVGSSNLPTGPATTTPATTTQSPTTSPTNPGGATEPVLPARAKQQSTAGAKAFVRYYIDVLNHAHKAESTKLLQSVSSPDCQVCAVIGNSIEEMRRRGGRQRGAEWTARSVAALPSNGPDQLNFVVRLHIDSGTSKRSRHAELKRINAEDVHDVFNLVWHRHSWLLHDLTHQYDRVGRSYRNTRKQRLGTAADRHVIIADVSPECRRGPGNRRVCQKMRGHVLR